MFAHYFREFNTSVDIELHKWAESLQLAQLCANVRILVKGHIIDTLLGTHELPQQ